MKFKLTSSQMNFYNKSFTLDGQIWNQGVMQVFPKVYTYQQLNDAYNKLVSFHDSLRVKLKETADGVVADVEEHKYINYRFWQVETEEELHRKAQDFLNEPTDRYGLLVDCAVFQTPTTSGIMINAHHIVVDGYSAFVMSEHINQFLKDENFVPEIQKYSDYVEKEEKHKQSRRFAKDKEFWLKQFSSNPDCNIFSTQENLLDFASAEVNCEIPADLFEKVKAVCNENEITPASFFNAVNAVYLHKKYDVDNFTIGVPVLNRTTPDELNTIGLYMHLVPLVINVQPDSFIANAQRIDDSQMNLFRHQQFTQQDIKELLKENNHTANQLFDIVSDFQEFSRNDDYEMRIPYGNFLSVPVEMHLQSFSEDKHNLKIRYRTAYFNETDVQDMLNSLMNIIKCAVDNADENITKIPLYSAEEINRVLEFSKGIDYTYNIPNNSTLYSLFEKASEETKGKVCLKADDEEITFKDFKNYVERIDKQIRNITKEEKSVIGVICERSFEMYGAVYGIIRGGNAYLPIDPNYPQERIDYILNNSEAKAVITQGKFTHLAGNTPCIDATEILNNKEATEKAEILATPEDTAYVIYTSGSTGNPKGAKISHKSAVNRILWMHDKYPLNENDVILQKTPYTFDVSVWELFWWGMVGAGLAASKPDEHFLPAKILEETEKNKVTHLHFVPSVFDIFVTYLENNPDERDKFNTVKYVFLSGEALSASLVTRFYKLFNYEKVSLHNLYGPTECAVDVTYYDCTPTDIDPVPIGKPIYNTSIYIVDKNNNPLPIGVKGELCIGGVNVGQGYLNNPTLTAEKFIDNPFGEGKLYKTGDLAYLREDGQIIFCGRIDSQVKLNGQRIELGEIETVISNINGVEAVAVTVRNNNGKDILVAFYSGNNISENKIKEICNKVLPAYMVPTVLMQIEKMPLNPSGKLDRKALASFEVTEPENNSHEAPINDTEKCICDIFGKILNITDVSRNSDFFDLGGTSLSMISLLSEDEFKSISATDFIANPTAAKLAKFLESNRNVETEYLETLWSAPNSEKALVLFPFAGGGAEAYANFVESMKKADGSISIYFIKYLHSAEECRKAADEIERILGGQKICFYSHCVGSAVAMQILNILEENKNCTVEHYIAGGSIPAKRPSKRNIWNITPDFILRSILTKAGAPFDKLTKKEVSAILSEFRRDTDFSTKYFAMPNEKISCPLSLVINKNDIFTTNYEDAEQLWVNYCENIQKIHYIDSSSHYFQSDNSERLAETIIKILK